LFNFRVMRKHRKLVLWVMVVVFGGSLAVWGIPRGVSRRANAVLEVFGEEYSANDLARISYRRQLALRVDRMPQEQVVDFVMMLEEAKRQGIAVTQEQVREAALGVLGVEGAMSARDYRMVVSRRMGLPERQATEEFEVAIRDEIMVNTLSYLMSSDVPVTEEEMYAAYMQQNEEVRIRYAGFPAEELGKDVEVSEEEIREWYEEHRKEYFEPDRAAVEYVTAMFIKVKPEVEVTDEEVAKYYEENKENFLQKQPTPATESAVAEVEPTYRPLEEVKESIRTILTSEKVTEEIDRRISGASAEIDMWYQEADADPENAPASIDFEALAAKHKLDYGRTQLFDKDNPPAAISRIENSAEYAMTHEGGEISPVLRGTGQKMIIRVTERVPQRQLSLKESEEQIVEEIRRERGRERAAELAAAFAEKAKESGWNEAMEGVAAEVKEEVKMEETAFFQRPSIFSFRAQTIPGLGVRPKISAALGELELGEVSGPVEESDGWYVVVISESRAADPTGFESRKESLRAIMTQWKRLELLEAWRGSLEERAKVRDLTKAERGR